MTRKTLGVLGAAGLLALAAVAPVSAQAPDDPLGVVTIPPGEPVVIAGWGVISGADASLGTDWMNSMKVVADDRGGELLGHPLDLVFEDGLCTPEGGATAAQKLAADTTIVGLIGSACSDETVGGIAAITNAGLTTISPSNTRPALTAEDRGPEYAGYLRTAHNDLVQGAFVADFAYQRPSVPGPQRPSMTAPPTPRRSSRSSRTTSSRPAARSSPSRPSRRARRT